MTIRNKYVRIEDCRKCKKYKGEVKRDYVKCELREGTNVTALIAPASQIPGIKNGAIVVRCHDVPQDKELAEKLKNLKVKK